MLCCAGTYRPTRHLTNEKLRLATLYFDIELLETEEGPAPVNVFKQIDMDNDAALSREELSVYLKQQVRGVPIVFVLFDSILFNPDTSTWYRIIQGLIVQVEKFV